MEVVMGPDSIREARLTQLIQQHEKELLKLCCIYLRDVNMAEDAVQETFIKAYKTMDAFRGECSERTWLARIAVNTCKDMRRSAWYRFVDRRVTLDSLPEPIAPASSGSIRLTETIMRMPRKDMEVLLLYYYQGMTMEEVGQALHISAAGVAGRLKRARARLKDMMKGEGEP